METTVNIPDSYFRSQDNTLNVPVEQIYDTDKGQ